MLDLDHVFAHHPPTSAKIEKHTVIREAAKAFAKAILLHTPPCADQSAAIRHVRDAMMTANAALALDGRLDYQPRSDLETRGVSIP